MCIRDSLYGVPYILWDNIARGSQITCPHVQRSCTAKFYIDRKLGVSEAVATAGSTIHIFTGNNISPRGDLASRSLGIRINVDRPKIVDQHCYTKAMVAVEYAVQ